MIKYLWDISFEITLSINEFRIIQIVFYLHTYIYMIIMYNFMYIIKLKIKMKISVKN